MKGLILIFLFSCHFAVAQKMPSDYFQEGNAFYENKQYAKALESFEYIVLNHPKSNLYPMAYYNMVYIYYLQEQYSKAKTMFMFILKSQFNEEEAIGGGLMTDPYANYRHRASKLLSQIYYKQELYDSALHFFTLADSVYPYLHFCGNEYEQNAVETALGYADIYKKLNKPEMAIYALLPVVFIRLQYNKEVLLELKQLLQNQKNLKKELDESLSRIYTKEGKNHARNYFIRFLEKEIALPNNYENENTAISEIKKSDFYKMIINLK